VFCQNDQLSREGPEGENNSSGIDGRVRSKIQDVPLTVTDTQISSVTFVMVIILALQGSFLPSGLSNRAVFHSPGIN